MNNNRIKVAAFIAVFMFFSTANAQRAEVTVILNEAFFDAILDAAFQNFDPIEFQIGAAGDGSKTEALGSASFIETSHPVRGAECREVVRLLREKDGVKTAVRLRDGAISVPLAFSGNYDPPFVGCVPLSGTAEAAIALEFDRENQRLIGRANISSVNLTGSNGIGSQLVAKLVTRSLGKKLNPIEIVRLDKLSFAVPLKEVGNLSMRATAVRHEILNGELRLHVTFEFKKS